VTPTAASGSYRRLKGWAVTDTAVQPDSTAVRTALWRALHLEVDAPPHVLDDRIGLQLGQRPIPIGAGGPT